MEIKSEFIDLNRCYASDKRNIYIILLLHVVINILTQSIHFIMFDIINTPYSFYVKMYSIIVSIILYIMKTE